MAKQKKDLLLIAIVLVIAAGGFLINHIIHRKPASAVEVTVDGHLTHTFDLTKDTDTVIDGYNGGTNHLIIKNGVVWVSKASCPDKVCVGQGRITMNGEMLVCLPNRLIVKIISPEE